VEKHTIPEIETWLERENELETKITTASLELGSMQQRLTGANTKVRDLRNRLAGCQSRPAEQGLPDDLDAAIAELKRLESQRNLLTSELENLRSEQKALAPQLGDEVFSPDGLRSFVAKALSALMKTIKENAAILKELDGKRQSLQEELADIDKSVPAWNESELLNVSVQDHLAKSRTVNKASEKEKAISTLLEQVNSAIERRMRRDKELKEKFVCSMSKAVNAYASFGGRLVAEQISEILKVDAAYHDAATAVCKDLADEIGSAEVIGLVLGAVSASGLSLQMHLINNDAIRNQLEELIKSAS
jgi:DNA repair exonuclease SbcCD ATPase subunit